MKIKLWDGNVCVASAALTEEQADAVDTAGILLFVNDYFTFQGFFDGYCNFSKVAPPVNVATWFN